MKKKEGNKKLLKADKKPLYKKHNNLTKMEKETLKDHSKHHTKKHMEEMKQDMKKGYCFQQAHNRAMKKVGK